MRVGFVGLGAIGKPMALRLAASEHDLAVFDVAPGPAAELAAAGAVVADDVESLAARVDVLCVMVRDDAQVRDVLGGVRASSEDRTRVRTSEQADLLVVVHSTVAPHTPGELADGLEHAGLSVVDAPVSGGPMAAVDGTLAIMVGASEADFERCRPVLDVLGSQVVHAGPVGAGTRFKLARNLVHFVAFTAVTEAQRLAEAAGLDLVELGQVVRHTDAITGGPGAIMHRHTAAPIAPTDPWRPIMEHVVALGDKDLRCAIELADDLGVDVPLARLAREHLAAGLGVTTTPTASED